MPHREDDYDLKDPAKWLHAEALGGAATTLRIRATGWETIDDHHGKVEERMVFDFSTPNGREIKPRYLSSPTNSRICRQVFGRYWNDWVGHLITLAPVPSQIGDSGLRIAFVGSPEIDREMKFKVPGFAITFKKTKLSRQDDVDPVTGEIASDDDKATDTASPPPNAPDGLTEAERALFGDDAE